MTHTELANNPFMLITHPEIVLAAIEKSADLERLVRRQCRPLDKPLLGNAVEQASEDAEAANDADVANDTEAANDDTVEVAMAPSTLVSD